MARQVITLNLAPDAMLLLRQLAPGPHRLGLYISQLLYAERARIEERQRLVQERAQPAVLAEVGK